MNRTGDGDPGDGTPERFRRRIFREIRLAPGGRWLRLGLAAAFLLVLLSLALPGPWHRLSPLPCAFHALTGLPCLFCGGTRAVSAILHGNVPSAVYLNPLAFPALALAGFMVAGLLVEAAAGRTLALREVVSPRLSRFVPILILPALAWWMLHIYLAVKVSKPELADFKNPIAARAKAMLDPGMRRTPVNSR